MQFATNSHNNYYYYTTSNTTITPTPTTTETTAAVLLLLLLQQLLLLYHANLHYRIANAVESSAYQPLPIFVHDACGAPGGLSKFGHLVLRPRQM